MTQPPIPTVYPQPALAPQPKPYSASHWQIHAWGIGVIASYFMYEQFYLINNIHPTVFKVSPILVGYVLACPRLVDGLLDPLLGHWSDNMHSRWGRRRPFLLFSALVGALMASSLFWMSPEWPQWAKALMLAASAITLFTACGTYDMAHTALGFELSEGYADRSRIQAIRAVYHSSVTIIGGAVIGLASKPQETGDDIIGAIQWAINGVDKACHFLVHSPGHWTPFLQNLWLSLRPHATFRDEVTGFRFISGCVSILMVLSVLFPLIWSHEHYTKVNRKHVNLWAALQATLKCRPFVIILIINMAKGTGTFARNLTFYIGVYFVCFGNKATYTNTISLRMAFWSFVFALVLWPLTKPLTRLIGKRTAFIAGAGCGFLQACLVPLVATPGHVVHWLFLNLAFLPINHILGTAAAGIMPDICDIDELQHGERREGLFTAVGAFFNKMEISVMSIIGGHVLAWTGYNASFGIHQPPEVLERLRFWGFAPLIVIGAVAFVLSFFMPITHKMMTQVRAELDTRRAAKITVTAPDPLGGFPVEPKGGRQPRA